MRQLGPPPSDLPQRILLVDDVPSNLALLARTLEPQGYEILVAQNGEDALRLAAVAEPQLILMDVMMPGLDGLGTCRRLKQDPVLAHIPVLFITALDDREAVVRGFAAGGIDYIIKPFHAEEVLARVDHQMRLARLYQHLAQVNSELADVNQQLTRRMVELEHTNHQLAEERDKLSHTQHALQTADAQLNAISQREATRWGIAGFIGKSPTMNHILEDIRKLHQSAATSVLITGESGTGKELIARAIHYGSPRAQAAFIPVNCVAIPAELAESLLFGHVKGAFTGAAHNQKGLFELAHGGTLFLDEIGDMPLGLQAKLLRVLEDGEVRPIGSNQPISTNVRVLAATNVALQTSVACGRFRADLYYRLARFHVALPPLRERRDDIMLLANHFIQLFATEMGVRPPVLHDELIAALRQYNYPGNIRELKNMLERALILAGGKDLSVRHLQLQPSHGLGPLTMAEELVSPASNSYPAPHEMPLNLKAVELIVMRRALEVAGGNVSEAARLLGVHRTKLYRVMGDG